jgi:hypothetical protein
MDEKTRRDEEVKLLAAITQALPQLQGLWQKVEDAWDYEDSIYRFYHQSFKVYHLQSQITEMVDALRALAPHLPLNPWFMQIMGEGTNEKFSPETNNRWLAATRPIVEAFFHARFFLQMVCKYGKRAAGLKESLQRVAAIKDSADPGEKLEFMLENPLPSGWAAVLELYGLR